MIEGVFLEIKYFIFLNICEVSVNDLDNSIKILFPLDLNIVCQNGIFSKVLPRAYNSLGDALVLFNFPRIL